jgi:hypothetical protein
MTSHARHAGDAAMITKLSIASFKSIRQLDIDCRKVNLFIGEPNTGKSNILEALALLSWCGHPAGGPLSHYVRFQSLQDLFYDQLLDQEVTILASGAGNVGLRLYFERDQFVFAQKPRTQPGSIRFLRLKAGHMGDFSTAPLAAASAIKFYRFTDVGRYDDQDPSSLRPPNGRNLFSVVFSSKYLRETMEDFFQKYGLKLLMRQNERIFELVKQTDGPLIAYPYALASDTLRRIIFYTVAIASNKDSVLVFEEPESNAFPYYTKYLGERIALDETNQFFIATHNPYLLSAIVEKGRKEDVQVFVTYFEDYQTKVKPLTPEEVSELMEADPFFNLDRFVEEKQ